MGSAIHERYRVVIDFYRLPASLAGCKPKRHQKNPDETYAGFQHLHEIMVLPASLFCMLTRFIYGGGGSSADRVARRVKEHLRGRDDGFGPHRIFSNMKLKRPPQE
jgi:hypothetical protein